MIELVEVHEPKVAPSTEPPKLSFTDGRGVLWRLCGEIENKNGGRLGKYVPVPGYERKLMIDTDFEKQKQQGKRGLSMFEQVVKKHQIPTVEVSRLERLQEGGKPEKPHWFERFLRWWYDL